MHYGRPQDPGWPEEGQEGPLCAECAICQEVLRLPINRPLHRHQPFTPSRPLTFRNHGRSLIFSYSEFLKRDDQVLALRLQQEAALDRRKKAAVDLDRARAQNGEQVGAYPDVDQTLDEDVVMDDIYGENYGEKTIVIHVGSQNLRLGLATDALPKTVPMVIARKADRTEAEDSEPVPKRIKLDDDTPSEEWFGEEVSHSE